jgi:hypothetical protein
MRQLVQQEQLRAFMAWLPSELHNAPGMNWSLLPPDVMRYCLQSMGKGPDTLYLAMAVAAAYGAISPNSLLQLLRNLHALLNALRAVCGMEDISDLHRVELWNEFAARTQPTKTRSQQLSAYSAMSAKHYPRYLAELQSQDASVMQRYRLPPLPVGFLSSEGRAYELNTRSRDRQQVIRETLLPLVPALCELVVLRKRAMRQVLDAFHRAQQQVELGASLPLAFALNVRYPSLAPWDETWKLQQQDCPLHFWLWDRRSWVLGHQERYSQNFVKKVREAKGPYAPEQEQYFVEFDGQASELLWFGDLVEHRLLQHLSATQEGDPTLSTRLELARALGCSHGCSTGIGGLLQPDTKWLAFHARAGDLLFDPEALFRGVLYSAALGTLALISGATTGELLHISADRWVNEPEGTFQRLIPERAQAGEELLLEISPQAMTLLQEIEHGLVKAHGEVPIVAVSRQVARFDLLRPERYVFQWREHMLSRRDTEVLVLLLLHKVDVKSVDGMPIPLTLDHLCLGGNVPLEARARALKKGLGFNQTILPHLSRQTLDAYCRALYAYFDYAGSVEGALQPLTLARWMAQMLNQGYERETVNRLVSIVQHLFREASALGFIDREGAAALQGIEQIPSPQTGSASNARDDIRPHLWFSLEYKKCGKLNCSVCQEAEKRGHGPYWYAFWSKGGKQYACYIGRVINDRTIAAAFHKKVERLRVKQAAELGRGKLNEDALASLVPVLSQLVTRRVQLSETVLAAIRQAQLRQGGEGSSLPYRFQFATIIPELDPGGTLRERAVVLCFTLWNKRSWVARHPTRFSQSTIDQAHSGTYAYSEKRNTCFVQFHGNTHNALWFGDLLEHALLRKLEPEKDITAASKMRNQYARGRGFPRGCHTTRPGLLDTSDRWFAENARFGELLFEPEALHRGILYGAALALLSTLDGLEALEVLQVSADQWVEPATGARRDEQEQRGTSGVRFAQNLLPGTAHTGDARRLYPISAATKDLLDQIVQGLVDASGDIPVVQPGWLMTQRIPFLRSERYLFQSHASADGSRGILHPLDVTVLVRFVLYGTPFSPEAGTWPSTKLLRLSAPLPAMQQERKLKRLRDTLLAPLEPDLKPSSLQAYRLHLLAYLRYAGSAERAYQPETLRQWIEGLADTGTGKPFAPDAIDQRATVVRRCMVMAARLGNLDWERAQAFNSVRVQRYPDGIIRKRGPVPKDPHNPRLADR